MSAAREIARDGSIGHDLFLAKPFALDAFLGEVERLANARGGKA